jgi:hypothetical protein
MSSSSSSIYSPFNENNDYNYFNYINRTFEEIVCERGESVQFVDYSLIFDKIKSKLFDLNNFADNFSTECPLIKKFTEEIETLKREVCDIYLEFMEADSRLTLAQEKYTNFCENIKNCIESICETPDDHDIQLKQLLEQKIETFYSYLKIDTLIADFNKKNEIFQKTKYRVSLLSGTFLPTTICQICMENQVEYFIDPCGHTICKLCKSTCENKSVKCHYCRTVRNSYKRIYL